MTSETPSIDDGRIHAAVRLAESDLSLPYRRERGVPRTMLVVREGRTLQVVLTSPALQTVPPGWQLWAINPGVLLASWRNPDTWLLVDPGLPAQQVWQPAALRSAWVRAGIPSAGGSRTGPQEDPQPLAITPNPQRAVFPVFGLLGLVGVLFGPMQVTPTLPLLAGLAAAFVVSAFVVQRYVRELRYAWRLRGLIGAQPARRGRPPRSVVVAASIGGVNGLLYLGLAIGWPLISLLRGSLSGWNFAFLLLLEPLILLFVYLSFAGVRHALSGVSRGVTIPLHVTNWFGWLASVGTVLSGFTDGWTPSLIAYLVAFSLLILLPAYARRQLARPESHAWFMTRP